MKKFLIWGVCFLLAVMLLRGSALALHAYLIKIYTKLNISREDVRGMQQFYRRYIKDFDTLSPADRKDREKERLQYELKVLDAVEPFIGTLEDSSQIEK